MYVAVALIVCHRLKTLQVISGSDGKHGAISQSSLRRKVLCSAILHFFQIYDKDVSSVVLLLWIFVVYDRKLWVLAFMGLLLLGEIAAVATILAMSFSNFHGAL